MYKTWTFVLLDYDVSKTLFGEDWLKQYVNSLNCSKQQKVLPDFLLQAPPMLTKFWNCAALILEGAANKREVLISKLGK